MTYSNSKPFLQLSPDQLNDLRKMCHDLLLGKYYETIRVGSSTATFNLSEEKGKEGIMVTWQELCLFILPQALGIQNIIINVENPIHPADYIISEYERSKNPEQLNA